MKPAIIGILTLGIVLPLFGQPNFTPPTPLFREVMRNNTAGAKELLAQGADPNQGKIAGFSAIFFPVMRQNIDLFKAMVAKGADLQVKDRLGSNVLMWAAFDEAAGTVVGVVVEKPRLAEHAGALGLDDVVVLHRDIDVIAHAAAKGAGGIFDDRHGRIDRFGGSSSAHYR